MSWDPKISDRKFTFWCSVVNLYVRKWSWGHVCWECSMQGIKNTKLSETWREETTWGTVAQMEWWNRSWRCWVRRHCLAQGSCCDAVMPPCVSYVAQKSYPHERLWIMKKGDAPWIWIICIRRSTANIVAVEVSGTTVRVTDIIAANIVIRCLDSTGILITAKAEHLARSRRHCNSLSLPSQTDLYVHLSLIKSQKV
jgi:hypothetical protein